MAKFEKVSRFNDIDLTMPERKTKFSAGYDFEVAEDIIIPAWKKHYDKMANNINFSVFNSVTLEDIENLTKQLKTKPTLVSTGMKCELGPDEYLELSVRSSCPLKNWLILANGVGIIDSDYYNNPDNEGEIYFQFINLSPYDIELHKGDRIGQGIIKKYICVENDKTTGQRQGGFGSTSEALQKTAKAWQQIGFNAEEATKALKSITEKFYDTEEINKDRGLRAAMSIYDEAMGAGEIITIPLEIENIEVTSESQNCIDSLGNKIASFSIKPSVNIACSSASFSDSLMRLENSLAKELKSHGLI